MPLVEVKGFNPLIDNKPFFDQPVKTNKNRMKNLLKCKGIINYTTENLLDYLYHQKYYKVIVIDFSRQTNTNIHEQNNFLGKLEEDDDTTMSFIIEKQQKAILNFSLDSLILKE